MQDMTFFSSKFVKTEVKNGIYMKFIKWVHKFLYENQMKVDLPIITTHLNLSE